MSSGPNPFGANSVYSAESGQTFRWLPDVPVAGNYDVFAYWTVHQNRSMFVSYRIFSSDVISAPVIVNQQVLGGDFRPLGTFTFDGDGDEYIEVSSEAGQASADAIRIVPVP